MSRKNCFVQRLFEEMAMPFFRYFSLSPLLFPFVNPRVSCKFCLLCHLAVNEKSVTSVKQSVTKSEKVELEKIEKFQIGLKRPQISSLDLFLGNFM